MSELRDKVRRHAEAYKARRIQDVRRAFQTVFKFDWPGSIDIEHNHAILTHPELAGGRIVATRADYGTSFTYQSRDRTQEHRLTNILDFEHLVDELQQHDEHAARQAEKYLRATKDV